MRMDEALNLDMRTVTLYEMKSCAQLRREIREIEENMEELREKLKSARTSTLSIMPRSKAQAPDTLANAIVKLSELENKYVLLLASYIEAVYRVENAIASVWKVEIRRIMRLKYIKDHTWADIAEKVCYDERWCRKLNGRGLRMLGIEDDEDKKKGA